MTEAPEPKDRFDLLAGFRVLDLSGSIAGPYASLLLADAGAEVVKVELPGEGDDARRWGPPFARTGDGLWFAAVNRNKRSLALDYRSAAGLATLHELVARADVLIANYRAALQKRLGVDSDTLAAINPKLVHCSITGFGLTGPDADLPAYDLIAEGYSGVMDLTGEPDGPPQKIGAPAADLLAGMDAAQAITASLLDRALTGGGHAIDVSLVESMTRFMACRIVPAEYAGEYPRRSGARDSVIAVYQVFDTADEPITLGLGNDRIFARFCAAVERPEWVSDPRYLDNASRREHRTELVQMIGAVIATRSRSEWLALFNSSGVPAGPIYRLDELAGDEHLRARGLMYSIEVDGESIPQVGTGWHLDGRANGCELPPPKHGEHTDEVLREWLA